MFFGKGFELSIGISTTVAFVAQAKINVEVGTMVSIIGMICVMAGTTLLGQSGDMFPILRENGQRLRGHTVDVWERAEGGSIPPLPRHPNLLGVLTYG
jgi:hypothetical protein